MNSPTTHSQLLQKLQQALNTSSEKQIKEVWEELKQDDLPQILSELCAQSPIFALKSQIKQLLKNHREDIYQALQGNIKSPEDSLNTLLLFCHRYAPSKHKPVLEKAILQSLSLEQWQVLLDLSGGSVWIPPEVYKELPRPAILYSIVSLRDYLKNPREDIRQRSVALLGCASPYTTETIPLLLKALQDPKAQVAKVASFNLARQGKNVLPYLRKLQNPDDRLRQSIVWIIGKVGSDASTEIPYIIQSLESSNPKIQQVSLWALQHIGIEALPFIWKSFQKNQSSQVLKTALDILESSEKQVPCLKNLVCASLQSNQSELRKQALIICQKIPQEDLISQLIAVIENGDIEERKIAIGALGNMPNQLPALVIRRLFNLLSDEQLQKDSVLAIAKSCHANNKVLEILYAFYKKEKNSQCKVTYLVAFRFWKTHAAKLCGPIWKDIQDPILKPDIVRTIGFIGGNRKKYIQKVAYLALKEKKNTMLVIQALGRMGELATPYLIQIASIGRVEFRVAIQKAILGIGSPSLPYLEKALKGSCSIQRRVACEVLAQMGNSAHGILLKTLTSQHFWIKKAGAYSLEKAGSPIVGPIVQMIKQNENVCLDSAFQVLSSLKHKALPYLICTIDDENVSLAQFSIRAIKKVDPSYREAIPEMLLLLDNPKPLIKQSTLWCLGKIQDRNPIILKKVYQIMKEETNPQVQAVAAETLKMLNS